MSIRAIPSPAWSWRQAAYIRWLATPSRLRAPDTELALSKTLGLRLSVLAAWRELPGFMPAVRKAAREALGQRYADVLHKLEGEALNGSIQHLKLYLQLFGEEVMDAAAPQPNVKVLIGVDLARVGRADTSALRSEAH
jgi:hypothetical protein